MAARPQLPSTDQEDNFRTTQLPVIGTCNQKSRQTFDFCNPQLC
jgi:hypothetical protein